jgi:hypothetical protein
MDYQLKPIGKTCSQSGRELVPGEVCFSAVFEKGSEWQRLDFSGEAWKGPPDGAFGYWKCTVPLRGEVKRRALDPDALLRHFEEISEEANPAREKFRYVLALLLVQRRRLRISGSRTDGAATYLELAGMQAEGPFEVRELQLEAGEVSALENELSQHLTS